MNKINNTLKINFKFNIMIKTYINLNYSNPRNKIHNKVNNNKTKI
jgi:hypothetical protein